MKSYGFFNEIVILVDMYSFNGDSLILSHN